MSKETIQTIIRSVLKIGGGFLVAKGLADDAAIAELSGAVVTIVGFVWGILAAKKAAKAA